MFIRRSLVMLAVVALLVGGAFGQISGNIMGTVVDPGDASVPGVDVQIKDVATGTIHKFTTANEGIFRFNNIPPGTYFLTAKVQGFKTYTQQDINLASAETRDLGKIQLSLGSLTEEVSVVATATAVQTASSEKSSLVDGNQLSQIAIKGRDLMAMLNLVPGVVSTGAGEAASESSIGGVNVNGGGTSRTNFTVDGIIDLDTGSNGTTHFNPNMDSVAEVRVLTSNFQAEFGRMASGSISVITKGGGQSFHGSGWWTWRHEQFNAKNFFENFNNQPKSIYRYHVRGFSVGGPIYVPKLWNTNKQKLFFFLSQEYTKQRPATQLGYANMPTALERGGDFSQSVDQNGKMIQLLDPTSRNPIPGNIIPKTQISAAGLAFLNYLPMPNRCGASGAARGLLAGVGLRRSSTAAISDRSSMRFTRTATTWPASTSIPPRNCSPGCATSTTTISTRRPTATTSTCWTLRRTGRRIRKIIRTRGMAMAWASLTR